MYQEDFTNEYARFSPLFSIWQRNRAAKSRPKVSEWKTLHKNGGGRVSQTGWKTTHAVPYPRRSTAKLGSKISG
jgi:hypothetical protein